MGDAENALHPSKKRAAGRQITQLDPEPDDDVPESEMGTFKRASDEVLATRRIVKVRRHQSASEPSSNPFAGIRLVPTDSGAKTNSVSLQSENCSDKEAVEEQNVSSEKCEKTGEGKGAECGAAEELVASNMKYDKTEVGKGSECRASENELNGADSEKYDNMEEGKGTECRASENELNGADSEKYDKMEEGKGTECRASENELNGAEQASKIADAVNASATKLGENGETDAGEEVPQIGECVKEVKNGGKEAEMKAQPEIDEDKQKSEEESEEKTDAVVGEETDEAEKQVNELKSTTDPAKEVSSFQQLSSSKNAFTGLSGIGFPTSSFSFGTITEGSTFGASAGLAFGSKENASFPSFGFGSSNNGSSHVLFGTSAHDSSKNGGGTTPSMQEVPVETGEENEQVAFNAEAILYEYFDGGWKERGKGGVKLNVPISGDGKARLVMRARGNYRLILNARLYPDMALTNMDKKGITFACVNSCGEGKDGLTTFALKFKDSMILDEFRGAVAVHKGKNTTELKAPENSPKACDG